MTDEIMSQATAAERAWRWARLAEEFAAGADHETAADCRDMARTWAAVAGQFEFVATEVAPPRCEGYGDCRLDVKEIQGSRYCARGHDQSRPSERLVDLSAVRASLRERSDPAPDANCVTRPDGECVSDRPCMHDAPSPLGRLLRSTGAIGPDQDVRVNDALTEETTMLPVRDPGATLALPLRTMCNCDEYSWEHPVGARCPG